MKFNIERLKLKCEVLRQHIATCNERLDEVIKQIPPVTPMEFIDHSEQSKYKKKQVKILYFFIF